MLARQTPGGESRPVPIGSQCHRSESPTGYSSTGCSPAEPPPLHQSATIVTEPAKAQIRCLSSLPPGVSSLLCTPGDISILRRQQQPCPAGRPQLGGYLIRPKRSRCAAVTPL